MAERNSMKEKLPASEMKEATLEFCKTQNNMEVAILNGTDFPIIEKTNYKYIDGKHILLLVGVSRLLNKIENGANISGLIFDKEGTGLKASKRLYGNYRCKAIKNTDEWLINAVKDDKMFTKMLNHGAKFFELELIEGTIYYSGNEIFTLDKDYNASFAKFHLNGLERFENSYKILMEYQDRKVIFNVYIENGVYYTLTSAASNKVEYIKNGGVCKFFDGKYNHFESKVEILSNEKVEEINEKLKATNNAFFKNTNNLLALSFSNSK